MVSKYACFGRRLCRHRPPLMISSWWRDCCRRVWYYHHFSCIWWLVVYYGRSFAMCQPCSLDFRLIHSLAAWLLKVIIHSPSRVQSTLWDSKASIFMHAPRYPWGVKNKFVTASVPDPLFLLRVWHPDYSWPSFVLSLYVHSDGDSKSILWILENEHAAHPQAPPYTYTVERAWYPLHAHAPIGP